MAGDCKRLTGKGKLDLSASLQTLQLSVRSHEGGEVCRQKAKALSITTMADFNHLSFMMNYFQLGVFQSKSKI